MAANLSGISVMLQYTDFYDSYKSYIRKLFSEVAERLGWDAKDGESKCNEIT